MANLLIIWDNNREYVEEQLCWDFGASFPNDAVFSFDELKNNKFISEKEAIIVLLDTNIDEHRRTEFYGLDIIKYLRKEVRFKGLIIAYSSYEEKHFKEMKNAEILFTSGIRLKEFTKKELDTDEIEQLIRSVPKLSDDLLDDIIFSTFDSKGRIHEYLHNLKNDLNVVDVDGVLVSIVTTEQLILEKYKKLLQREIDPQKIIDFNNTFDFLTREIETDIKNAWAKKSETEIFTYTNAGSQISKFSNQIAELTPVSNDDSEHLEEEKGNWEVLFLDDKQDVREIVCNFFKEKNVICHLAATEEEAYQKLKENSPKISLFLTDIRLLDENEHWTDRQGYDIIEQVHQTNDYPLVYSVLTSKKGTINKMVQKKRSYEILWFTKEDVINNSHSFSLFFDMIKKYAEDNYNSNTVFQPEYTYWNESYKGHYAFPLKAYYRYHKESRDYPIEESILNKKTLEWIQGNGVKPDWMNKLLKEFIYESEIIKFRETKLLGRRVALALAAENQGVKGIVVYNIMTGNDKTDIDSSVKVFFSKFALSSNLDKMINQAKDYFKGESPSPGILYEEYGFLKTEYFEELFLDTYNLDGERSLFLKFVSIIEKAFEELKIAVPYILNKIKTILEEDGTPSIERLNTFASFLKETNETYNLSKAKAIKNLPIDEFQNERIRIFLRQADLAE
ncbi:hypothetical protein AGMMS50262_21270 [Bacteroidia bacterium]|nr:hypothetical protein AGMMS50262_21270 [Bacteroidia bacterium]